MAARREATLCGAGLADGPAEREAKPHRSTVSQIESPPQCGVREWDAGPTAANQSMVPQAEFSPSGCPQWPVPQ